MPKTHYAVTDRNGRTHKRSTESRTYTHVTLARESEPFYRSRAAQFTPTDESNYHYYLRELGPSPRYNHTQADLERIRARILGPDLESHKAATIAQQMADHESQVASGRFDQFTDMGWSGSHELARKNAAKLRGRECWAEILILPAVVVTK
jgi:hypothetical protein